MAICGSETGGQQYPDGLNICKGRLEKGRKGERTGLTLVAVYRRARHSQFGARPQYPRGDLPPIRGQYLLERRIIEQARRFRSHGRHTLRR